MVNMLYLIYMQNIYLLSLFSYEYWFSDFVRKFKSNFIIDMNMIYSIKTKKIESSKHYHFYFINILYYLYHLKIVLYSFCFRKMYVLVTDRNGNWVFPSRPAPPRSSVQTGLSGMRSC